MTVGLAEGFAPFRSNAASHHLQLACGSNGRPSLTLVPAGGRTTIAWPSLETTCTLIEFEPWFLDDTFGTNASFGPLSHYRDPKIEAIVKTMTEAAMVERHRDTVLVSLAAALCRALAVASSALKPRQDDAWINPNALRRVLVLVEEQLNRHLRVEVLAAATGLSASAFLRAFRGSMGLTPGDFVTARRIHRAESLLKNTRMPVASVARSCGFGSAAHFSTTFKARRGQQPGTLRRSLKLSTPANRIAGCHQPQQLRAGTCIDLAEVLPEAVEPKVNTSVRVDTTPDGSPCRHRMAG